MSVRTMTRVWELDLPDSDKIVLLALADCANDEGHCWPSVASLVRKCSKSERTIQGSIKRLVDEGLLVRREVPGKGCNYTVLPRTGAKSAPRSDDGGETPAPPQGTTDTPAAAADKPSRTINSEAKASSQRVVDHYNQAAGRLGWPKVRVLDASRRQTLRLRLNSHGEAMLIEAIDAMADSPFIRGEGRKGTWRPDFDFLLQPTSLRRLLEGFYGADEKREILTDGDRRAELLKRAAFFDSINQTEQASDCRRRAALCGEGEVIPIGAAVSGALAVARGK
jgi:hypothetical protein